MADAAQSFQYLVAEKGPVQVVTFMGLLTREAEAVLEQCLKEILGRPATWVILNFREVPPEIDRKLFRVLVQLQKVIREAPKMLRITGVHPQLFALLEEQAILRRDEVFRNVAEALKSLQGG